MFCITLPASALLWALQYNPAPSPSLAKLLEQVAAAQGHSGCILSWMHSFLDAFFPDASIIPQHPSITAFPVSPKQSRDLAARSAQRGAQHRGCAASRLPCGPSTHSPCRRYIWFAAGSVRRTHTLICSWAGQGDSWGGQDVSWRRRDP